MDFFSENEYKPLMVSLKRREVRQYDGHQREDYQTLVLAAITDTHNDNKAIYNFLKFTKKYSLYIDGMVHMGDIVTSEFPDPYNHLSVEGYNKILLSLGNHDAYAENHHGFYDVVTEEQCYDKFFRSSIENWNVNYTSGLCYYYKDFTYQAIVDGQVVIKGIRYIVLDCMHWTEAQIEWLEGVLYEDVNDSAIAKGYQVIIAQHVPVLAPNSAVSVDFLNCSFTSKDFYSLDAEYDNRNALDIVATFQERGGIFVTWLFGHWHRDYVGKYTDYPTQPIIIQATGGIGGTLHSYSDNVRIENTPSENLFSIYSIDSEKKYIRILRVGAEYDRNLQHKRTLTLTYGNEVKILSNF